MRTYNRPHKPLLILLKPLNRILRIPRPLHKLPNPIRSLLSHATRPAHRRNVVQDTAQLVRGRRGGGDLQLELAALLLRVRGVVRGLVFCCGFGGGGGGLLEDVEGAG